MTDTKAVDQVSGLGPDDVKPPAGVPPSEGQPFIAICPLGPANMDERTEAGLTDKPVERSAPPVGGNKINGGTGHSFGPPKPVEVMSVPETPVNGSTPAGGTPRQELTIPEDPIPSAAEPSNEPIIEPIEMAGVEEPKSTSATSAPDKKLTSPSDVPQPAKEEPSVVKAPEPVMNDSAVSKGMDIDKPEDKQPAPVTHTGPESEPVPAPAPATAPVAAPPPEIPDAPPITAEQPAPIPVPNDNAVGEKRKLENITPPIAGSSATAKPPAEDPVSSDALPLDKKPKLDAKAASSNGEAAKASASALAPTPDPVSISHADPAPTETPKQHPQTSPKNGKAKKEKKLPPVGRTARKTRSQGPVDV